MASSGGALEYLEAVVYGKRRGLTDMFVLAGLRVLSLVYRSALRLYLLPFELGLRRRKRLTVPVISVGNITVGGTGKTPMTRYLCEGLISRGRNPAVLSYGYGGGLSGEFGIVSTPERVLLSPGEVGDEPAMLALKLPGVSVLVGKDRHRSGMHAVREFGAGIAVLDDGFQVWKLHRDLDIVLIDGMLPFDNGWTLPAGRLREPISSLQRADCVVVTGDADLLDEIRAVVERAAPRAMVCMARHAPTALYTVEGGERVSLESVRDRRVFAMSAIAHPASFEKTLADAGAVLAGCERFPDHHAYSQEDVLLVESRARACGAEFVVVTEKDAVKLAGMCTGVPLLALSTRLALSDEDGLWRLIERKLKAEDAR